MAELMKVLLVEDDPSFGSVLKDYLSMNDYNVTHALDGEKGLEKFNEGEFDICVLDVMMPKKDGFTLAKEIKMLNPAMPIIFLTAKNLREDVLNGYKIGSDDYITKPFDSEVLMYKLKAIALRNSNLETEAEVEMFEVSKFKFNSKLRQLFIADQVHKLSPKENELLKLLCIHKNDLMPRDLALNKIWYHDNYFTSRSMDVYIAKLRKLLKDDDNVEIVNIHGEGFRLLIKD